MSGRGWETAQRRIWAAVPFKGPVGSKRRLAGLLDDAERERLSLAMLSDVIDVLLGVPTIEHVLLLTPSSGTGGLPKHARLSIVDEAHAPNGSRVAGALNPAIRQAQRVAEASGADGLLIVPADLPLVEHRDVEAVLDAGRSASVVIVPDRAGVGTNALLLAPPAALDPSFGDASYDRHRHLAERAGLRWTVVERDGLGLDLDTPADVGALLASGRGGSGARLLRELGVGGRLHHPASAQARSTTI